MEGIPGYGGYHRLHVREKVTIHKSNPDKFSAYVYDCDLASSKQQSNSIQSNAIAPSLEKSLYQQEMRPWNLKNTQVQQRKQPQLRTTSAKDWRSTYNTNYKQFRVSQTPPQLTTPYLSNAENVLRLTRNEDWHTCYERDYNSKMLSSEGRWQEFTSQSKNKITIHLPNTPKSNESISTADVKTLTSLASTKELFTGSKLTNQLYPPGYGGHIPTSYRNQLTHISSLEGTEADRQRHQKDNLTMNYRHGFAKGYSGFVPSKRL